MTKPYISFCLLLLLTGTMFSCQRAAEQVLPHPKVNRNWEELPIQSDFTLQNAQPRNQELLVVSEKELFRIDQNNQIAERRTFQRVSAKNFVPVFSEHMLARGSFSGDAAQLEFHLIDKEDAVHTIDLSQLHPQANFAFPYVQNYLCAFNGSNDFIIVLYPFAKPGQPLWLMPFYYVFHIELANNNTAFGEVKMVKSGQLPYAPPTILSTVCSIDNEFYINFGFAYKTTPSYELTPLFQNWIVSNFTKADNVLYGSGHNESQELKLYYSIDNGHSWQDKPANHEFSLVESVGGIMIARIGSEFMVSDKGFSSFRVIAYDHGVRMEAQSFFKTINGQYYTNAANRLFVADSLVVR